VGPDVHNVKDYGAVGSGSVNDAPAIQAAITEALKSGTPGCVYFPAGTYRVDSLILFSSLTKPVVFVGEGDASVLQMASSSGLFSVTLAVDNTIEFQSLRFQANAAGPCLTITSDGSQNGHKTCMLRVRGCTFTRGTSYFTRGLVLTYVHNGVISDSMFDGTNKANSNIGIECLTICTNLAITGCNINFWTIAVKSGYNEGIAITNTVMVDVKYGVYVAVASDQFRMTGVYLNSVHIDARGLNAEAVHLDNVEGVFISGCYLTIGADAADGVACIHARQVAGMQIIGSKFNIYGTNGVCLANPAPSVNDIDSNPIGCIGVIIIGNAFEGAPTATVKLENLCMSCIVQNNTHYYRHDPPNRVKMIELTLSSSDDTGGTRGNVVQA